MRLYAGPFRFLLVAGVALGAIFAGVGSLARRSAGPELGPNTLRLANSGVPVVTLDPVAIGDLPSSQLAIQVFEGLVRHDYETLQVQPSLAESWTVSPDGRTYTFQIRRGVRFHDDPCFPGGKRREVTAEDVRYNFTRVCDPIALSTGIWLFESAWRGQASTKRRGPGCSSRTPGSGR